MYYVLRATLLFALVLSACGAPSVERTSPDSRAAAGAAQTSRPAEPTIAIAGQALIQTLPASTPPEATPEEPSASDVASPSPEVTAESQAGESDIATAAPVTTESQLGVSDAVTAAPAPTEESQPATSNDTLTPDATLTPIAYAQAVRDIAGSTQGLLGTSNQIESAERGVEVMTELATRMETLREVAQRLPMSEAWMAEHLAAMDAWLELAHKLPDMLGDPPDEGLLDIAGMDLEQKTKRLFRSLDELPSTQVADGPPPDIAVEPVEDAQATMAGGNARRSGAYSTAAVRELPPYMWTFPVEEMRRPATIASGRVFIPGSDGVLSVLDVATGRPLWTWPSGASGNFLFEVAVVDDVAYAVGLEVVALRASTGEILWRQQGCTGRGALVTGGLVICTTHLHSVLALDAATGEKRWEWTLPVVGNEHDTVRFGSDIAAVGDVIVFTTDLGVLQALHRQTGQPVWSAMLPGGTRGGTPAISTDGIIFLHDEAGNVTAWEAATGRNLWRKTFDYSGGRPVAVADGRVFMSGGDLHAIDASTGEIIWEENVTTSSHSVSVSGDAVYLARSEMVSAHDAASGEMLWRVSTDDRPLAAPAVDDDVVVISTEAGVFAYGRAADTSAVPAATGGCPSAVPDVDLAVIAFQEGDFPGARVASEQDSSAFGAPEPIQTINLVLVTDESPMVPVAANVEIWVYEDCATARIVPPNAAAQFTIYDPPEGLGDTAVSYGVGSNFNTQSGYIWSRCSAVAHVSVYVQLINMSGPEVLDFARKIDQRMQAAFCGL